MKVIIQAVPERMTDVNVMLKKVPNAEVYLDANYEGNLVSFKKSLSLHGNEYVLRLQDDVILPNGFNDFLPVLEDKMKANDIHVLSLFSLKRNHVTNQFVYGLEFATYPNFLMLQATIFSPYATEKLIAYSNEDTEKKHDDVLVRNFLKKSKIEAYVYLPNLVQHSLNVKSSLGHPQSKSRQSPYFDAKYIEHFFKELEND